MGMRPNTSVTSLSRIALRACLLAGLLIGSAYHAIAQPETYSAPEKDWYTIETQHFLVHYHEGAERSARVAAKVSEDIYGPITSLYDHEPDSKVSLIIKDISDYSNGAAYFFNNKIELWASPLDFDLRGTHNWMRNVIAHEFTHIIQMQAAMKWGRGMPAITFQWFGYEDERRTDVLYGFPNLLVSYPLPGVIVPPWLAEGTAQYMRKEFQYESWDAHRDMILRCYALSDSMLTWSEMGAFGKTSFGNESVYNAGYNFSRYLANTYGEETLVELTRSLAKPFTFTVEAGFEDTYGKSGSEIYSEWKTGLVSEYETRIAPVKEKEVSGNRIGEIGFGNFHPEFSPDGTKIAYTSNKTSDYFGQSAIFVYDREDSTETMLTPGVSSAISYSPDGKKMVYSRYNDPSVYGHIYYDLYVYDFEKKSSERLTKNLRAFNPSYSPDGSSIAFVYADDGTINIGVVDADGKNFFAVTAFANGEQCFRPRWTPDGGALVFGYAERSHRSVATSNTDGTGFKVLIGSLQHDTRDPFMTKDGEYIYYASNETGIFNIYRYHSITSEVEQITNVIGGAFMPAVDSAGALVYSEFTAGGYKVSYIHDAKPGDFEGHHYKPPQSFTPQVASISSDGWDWQALQNYDDTKLPEYEEESYTNVFQSMMFFPTLRIDEFNPDNKGLELFKPGLMMYSTDVLNRTELLLSASINSNFERDLYLNFTYRDKLPILSSFGIYPDFSFEVYNVTRSTGSLIPYPVDTVNVDVDFNLLEFIVTFRHALFTQHTMLELSYAHSRYTSTIGSFTFPETGSLVPATDNLYFIGNSLSARIRHTDIVPTRDREINPSGFRLALFYDYEFNRYNPDGDFELDQSLGTFVPVYTDFNFHRLDGQLFLGSRLFSDHTISLRLRGASIFGPPVNEFFDYYAGGITGMQGYTFYSLGGNELATANITYRFPLVKSLDLRIGHILFDKLYGGLFFDAGDAQDSPEEFSMDELKRDVGFELRLESYSFAMYPTRIFFSGAYGLDEFTREFNLQEVTYGKEWRWYFGVLFNFNLSDRF